jgi:hypothetical protein
LERDVSRIGEPRKVLKSFDIYISAHKQYKTNRLTAAGLGTTSFPVLITIVQSAIDLSDNSPPGTNGSSSLSCGLSVGNVVGAALALLAHQFLARLLFDGKSYVKNLKEQMDTELAEKLSRVQGKRKLVEIHGQN